MFVIIVHVSKLTNKIIFHWLKLKVLNYYCYHKVEQNKLTHKNKRYKVETSGYRFQPAQMTVIDSGPSIICQDNEYTKEGLKKGIEGWL